MNRNRCSAPPAPIENMEVQESPFSEWRENKAAAEGDDQQGALQQPAMEVEEAKKMVWKGPWMRINREEEEVDQLVVHFQNLSIKGRRGKHGGEQDRSRGCRRPGGHYQRPQK